jgi:transposase
MKKVIKRSLKFSLREANKSKKGFLDKLWEDYKKVLEYFIDIGWNEKRLPKYEDAKTMNLDTGLSWRYVSCALVQAQAILKSCFRRLRKHKKVGKPSIKKISMRLDERFVKIEKGNNSFDYWLAIRNPYEQKWVYFPVRNYEYAKNYQDWKLGRSVELLKQDDEWYVKFIFEREVKLEDKPPKGIDIGYRKLITSSDGEVVGREIKEIIERIDRKEQGSKNWRQLRYYLKTEIDRWLKSFIDGSFSPIIESLKNLKKGKKGIWSRDVNRKFNYWLYGYTIKRLKELCEVVGVQYHIVPAFNTSRTCLQCGIVDRLNRRGEIFKCISCGFTADADYVGAVNILRRFLSTTIPEEPKVPLSAKSNFMECNKCP